MFGLGKKQDALLAQYQRDTRRNDLRLARAIAQKLDEPHRSQRLAQIAEAERKLDQSK